MLTILLNVVNTVGGFLLNQLVENGVHRRWARWTSVSSSSRSSFRRSTPASALLGLLLQLFVASRAIRHWGVRGSLFILPIIALVNYSIIAVAPVLAVIRIGKILENSTDYSIQNTLRHALFLPTTREAKYKAKSVIDTFCTRFGDVLQAVVVFGGTAIGLGVWGFAWLNVGLTVAWLAVAAQIAREHRKKTRLAANGRPGPAGRAPREPRCDLPPPRRIRRGPLAHPAAAQGLRDRCHRRRAILGRLRQTLQHQALESRRNRRTEAARWAGPAPGPRAAAPRAPDSGSSKTGVPVSRK